MIASIAPSRAISIRTSSNGPSPLFLDEVTDPHADALAGLAALRDVDLQVRVIHAVQQPVQQVLVEAGIEQHRGLHRLEVARIGHPVRRDQVTAPHLDPVDTDAVRHRIQQPFPREGRFVASGRPVGARRRLVGQPDMGAGAVGRDQVRARQHRRREVDDGDAVAPHVGALVGKDLVVEPEDEAARIDGGADAVHLVARVVEREQVLAPVLDPLDRPAEPGRGDADQHVLRVELAPHTEPAADMALEELQIVAPEAQHGGDGVAVVVRHLGGAVELDPPALAVVEPERAARLDRHPAVPADGELDFENVVRIRERGIQVAVIFLDRRGLAIEAGEEAGRGFGAVDIGRLLVDLDEHGVGGVLGDIALLREHQRDRLADIADDALREDRLAVGLEPLHPREPEIDRRDVGHVRPGPHRRDALHRPRAFRADRGDPAMRGGRAYHPHVKLARRVAVVREPAPAGQQRPVLQAGDALADQGHGAPAVRAGLCERGLMRTDDSNARSAAPIGAGTRHKELQPPSAQAASRRLRRSRTSSSTITSAYLWCMSNRLTLCDSSLRSNTHSSTIVTWKPAE